MRPDISGSLPGVAVAVALVPPLSTVGVLLGADEPDLAANAMLLFLTNLVAIILAAIVVFALAGYEPDEGDVVGRLRLRRSILALLVLLVAISYPLFKALDRVLESNEAFDAAADIGLEFADATGIDVDDGTGVELLTAKYDDGRFILELLSPESEIPSAEDDRLAQLLSRGLARRLDREVEVILRWTPPGGALGGGRVIAVACPTGRLGGRDFLPSSP